MFARTGSHLGVPVGSDQLHHACDAVARLAAEQTLESLKKGEIRFGAGESFGAATACYAAGRITKAQVIQKPFNEGSLAETWLHSDTQHQTASCRCGLVGGAKFRPLLIATHWVAFCCGSR